MTQLWTIARISDGVVLAASFPTPSVGSHPKYNGWAWDAATQKATRIDAAPDLSVVKWSGTAWIDDVVRIEAALIADVKAIAESLKMKTASSGGYKKTEYAAKRAEVNAFDSLGGTVSAILAALALLPASRRETQFAYASADAAAFGDTIQAAIGRFRTGMTSSGSSARVAAAEAKACAAIRAATTGAAKRAAAAAIVWPA